MATIKEVRDAHSDLEELLVTTGVIDPNEGERLTLIEGTRTDPYRAFIEIPDEGMRTSHPFNTNLGQGKDNALVSLRGIIADLTDADRIQKAVDDTAEENLQPEEDPQSDPALFDPPPEYRPEGMVPEQFDSPETEAEPEPEVKPEETGHEVTVNARIVDSLVATNGAGYRQRESLEADLAELTQKATTLDGVVSFLETQEEWSAQTLDDIAAHLVKWGYAHVNDNGMFKSGPA